MKQGKLIVIDGTDGSGKETQTKLIIKRLEQEKINVKMADFPQYGQKSCVLVEEYLNGKFGSAEEVGPYKASLFFAYDRCAASPWMKDWLNQGGIIISNRYVSSNMGHQAGKIKNSQERDKFLDWLDDLEFNKFRIPRPNLTILLYMPVEIGQQLVDKKGHRDYVGGKKRDIHENDKQHLIDAAEAYKHVSNRFGWPVIECAPEGNLKSPAEINLELWNVVKKLI